MTGSKTDTEAESLPDPNLKEQDKGIIEAFARKDHHVLTNSEISEDVSLSDRQVRRRLDKLADQGVIGKRVVSGVKLAWLEKDVKEPITVQYPLLRYVFDHSSVQLFLIGLTGGVVSVLILLAAALAIGYEVPIGFIGRDRLLAYGVVTAAVSAMFIVVAPLMALVGQLMRRYNIDVESAVEKWRS